MTDSPTISRHQLIAALQTEYEHLLRDDIDDEQEFTLDEHLDYLNSLSYADLVAETCTDDSNPLSEFIYAYS